MGRHKGYVQTENHRKNISNAVKKMYSEDGRYRVGYWRGKKLSKNHKKRISLALLNHKVSEETKKKIGAANSGNKSAMYGKHPSEETLRKLSLIKKGHIVTDATRRKISLANAGRKLTDNHRKKISESNKGRKGYWMGKHFSEEHRAKLSINARKPRNKHGYRSTENSRARRTIEMHSWREAVFNRDNWTCFICRKRGGIINAHHMESFSINKALRASVENGVTLCITCHRNFHKIYGFKNNTKKQLEEFFLLYNQKEI